MRALSTICIFLWFAQIPVNGQEPYKFRPVNTLKVKSDDGLELAWAGGINSAQYGTIDLDGDGREDLTIFDRTTGKIQTFINDGSSYQYQPQYEYLLPSNLNSWMLLADYNCDGKKDIFTNTTFGLKVYKNTSGQQLSFELQQDLLMTESSGALVNLQVSSSDIPSISDVDGDGDLDILVFRFATGNSIEYHQNQSVENDGTCDQLDFKLITSFWGEFRECDCGEYAFGEDCDLPGGRQQHAGGKALITFDQDLDGDLDLVFSDEFCTNIAFLKNEGDSENALFNQATLDYPSASNPVDFFIFPGLFLEDLDFDGHKDLIASPNVFENLGNQVDFKRSSHFYSNDGVPGSEQFTFESNQFLQDQMIELGENATPAFFDFDGDGDQDLLIGHRGIQTGAVFLASFYFYENIGSSLQAEYSLASEDYLNLSLAELNTLKPSFGDIDGDGNIDLAFSAADANGQTNIYYFLNNASSGFLPTSSLPQRLTFEIQAGDHPFFSDLNADGRADLLLGKRTGRLEYWRNTSSGESLTFELIDDALSGVIDDSFRRELAPVAADINGDKDLELITTDATGVIRVYRNFLNQQESSSIQMFDLLIEPANDQQVQQSRLGRGATLAVASLGSQFPHIVVGSKQGGLFLMENLSMPANGSAENEFTIELFPNPGVDMITVRGNRNFTIEIYNNLGQLVMFDLGTPTQSLIRFDSRFLHAGMYIVHAISSSGARQARRLIVAR